MNEMIAYVRLYMRDFAALNRTIVGEESDDRMIAWAIVDAIDDFNSTPPFLGAYGLTNFPSSSLLCRGAAISLLESVALLQMRNHITFSDGGLSVSINDKTPMIMQWLMGAREMYEMKKKSLKASINLEAAMTGAGALSEYFVINGLYLYEGT